jgi:tRNA (cmo5U34)-methyltransferase
MRDKIFSESKASIADFEFNKEVVDVFPDMIRRSIPGYETIVGITGLIAANHIHTVARSRAPARLYDLGCSLGANTASVAQQCTIEDVEIFGVDSSEPMIAEARATNRDRRVQFICDDLRRADISGADVVICNFVLQFVPRDERLTLLQHIHAHLGADGLLLVSEKVKHDDSQSHDFYDATHLAWKRANGYSELEISQKRSALENVMQIDTEAEHEARFTQAGFSRCEQWYRCLNWASFAVHA